MELFIEKNEKHMQVNEYYADNIDDFYALKNILDMR